VDRNLLLAFALSFGVLTLWQMWQVENQPPPQGQSAPTEVAREAYGDPSLDRAPTRTTALPPSDTRFPRAVVDEPATAAFEEEIIRIERDLYSVELTNRGAGLRNWTLLDYLDKAGKHTVLPTGKAPNNTALLTPLRELGLGDLSRAHFELETEDGVSYTYVLNRQGVVVRKTFTFPQEGYDFTLRLEIENLSNGSVTAEFGIEWPSFVSEELDFKEQSFATLVQGSVETKLLGEIGSAGFFSEAQRVYEFSGEVEWLAAQSNYFVGLMVPDDPGRAIARFISLEPGTEVMGQLAFTPVLIPSGQGVVREFRGYVGPKRPERLEAFGNNAIQTIDFGWSWVAPMTRFFAWMLHSIYSFIPNYGVSIILLTLMVRIVTIPLTTKQMRSMERMRALQPQLKEIQEKHKADKQAQSEKTMELYRREKVNPLGGCLPMILQLPVFIGLFYALRSSIDLRQAPFIGWIDDLSAPESLFVIPGLDLPLRVLPLVMGATMVLQQRMTPMPSADPAQAKMMMIVMPIMMTVLFYQFPSGLVLYWMVSNVLAIANQRWVGRNIK